MGEIVNKNNYFKNTPTSDSRMVRLELVGDVSEADRHFLDGISFFVAGTLSKSDNEHTTYVADLMTKLIRYIVAKRTAEDAPDFLKEDAPKPKKELSPDAQLIRAPITGFIKRIICIVDVAFVEQKAKGTRPDLILTMIVGGLSFIAANAYYMIIRNLAINIGEEEYIETFTNMFKSALRDIGKSQ